MPRYFVHGARLRAAKSIEAARARAVACATQRLGQRERGRRPRASCTNDAGLEEAVERLRRIVAASPRPSPAPRTSAFGCHQAVAVLPADAANALGVVVRTCSRRGSRTAPARRSRRLNRSMPGVQRDAGSAAACSRGRSAESPTNTSFSVGSALYVEDAVAVLVLASR